MKTKLCLLLCVAGPWLAAGQSPPTLPAFPTLPAPPAIGPTNTNRLTAPALRAPSAPAVSNTARLTNTSRATPPAFPAFPSAPGAIPSPAPARTAGPAGATPLPTPPAPTRPAATVSAPPSPTVPAGPAGGGDEIIPVVDVHEMPIEQFLDNIYAMYSRRTVLRSAGISQLLKSTVSFRMQTPMRRSELVVAMDTLLALNNITMIPVGDKLVSAVPNATVTTEGAAFFKGNPESAPEGAQFMTHIAQLKYAKPSEIAPALQQFAKVPNGIVPIDSSRVIILRDYAVNVKRMMEVIDQVDRIAETDFKFEVIPIRFTKVDDLYYSINSLISGGGGPPPTRTGPGGFGNRPG
ncbi:MAG: hypothetical protein KGS61_05325, partial [Verrucomicrobia bacterium]|nr:hypothetical protein [Verrucomicrobiota bacterium]